MGAQSSVNPKTALEGVHGVQVVPHSPFALEEIKQHGGLHKRSHASFPVGTRHHLIVQRVWQQRPGCLRPIRCSCHGDRTVAETIANVITSLPFIALGLQAPRKNLHCKLYANSLIGVGIVSSLYHASRGKIRRYMRWADYSMIATATVCLSRALRNENPKLLMAASAVLLPIQPLMVSAVHTGMMEVVFAKRALQDPDLRMSHNVHKMSSLLGGALFIADDVFPETPFLHAGWHLAAAVGGIPAVMNPSTHQNGGQNPNVLQQQKEKMKQKKEQMSMKKLREAVFNLANSEPNVRLSEKQKVVLQQRISQFFSRLTTPDHPPYAWMIEKALKELKEKGGSSEDSISKFIMKEHASLPYAHTTMLKHHLQKMTEKGEIRMIGGRFLLPGDCESVVPKKKRKRKKRGKSVIKKKQSGQKEKEEEKQVQHDDVEVVGEQKDLDEQQNDVTVDENHGQENQIHEEYLELNEHHNAPSTDKEDGQLSDQQNSVTGNKVVCGRVLRSTVHKQKGKEQLDATGGSLQSSIAAESAIGCNSELQLSQLSLSTVEETADISNLYPQEILENEQPGDDLPLLLSPEAPPGFELVVVEDATENKAHTSSSVGLDLPKEDHVMPQSSDKPSEEEAVAEDLLKTKKQKKKHHGWQQTNRPMTRALAKGTVTLNEQPRSGRNRKQLQLAMESSSDRAQRQLKRWSKSPVEPKSAITSKLKQLALCDSADQQLVLMEEPLSISKPLCISADQHVVQMEEPLALAISEEALNLTDPQQEVQLKQPKVKRRGRSLKGKEDVADPDTTLLKDVGSSKKLTKKQTHRGVGRRRNAQ